MLNSPFAPWPSYSTEEAEIVSSVLLSNRVNYWTGNLGKQFEQDFAVFSGCKFAVALANGTLALELALRSLGVGPGDEVIVTPRSFIASVSAVVMVGGTPVFADVDRETQNISPETVSRLLTPRTRAIIAVHLAGWPCDMDGFMSLAKQHGLFVIEDCAQAHGARYKGRPVGGLGHVAAWSFCQDKILTTGGEGGMLTTNDHSIWQRAWEFKDHGKSWIAVKGAKHSRGFNWLHESIGSNWRMTEMQAALGVYQLGRIENWHHARNQHAEELGRLFDGYPSLVRCPRPPSHVTHAWYKFYAFIIPDGLKNGWSRDRILNEIQQSGVPCGPGSCSEIYLEKAFTGSAFVPEERLPVARELGETSMMFLVHPTLTSSNMRKTVEVVGRILDEALR